MVELRFMLRYSDTKACALNCAILPLSTRNVQIHQIPVLGQLGFYFDCRLCSISVRSSPRMNVPAPSIPVFLSFPIIQSSQHTSFSKPEWALATDCALREAEWQRTRNSESQLSDQRGFHTVYIFYLWKFSKFQVHKSWLLH